MKNQLDRGGTLDRPLSRAEVRDVDRRAIDEFGMPGILLMENAGREAAELLLRLGVDGPVTICAGKGNNGGDGFVIARHLENAGCHVRVLLLNSPEDIRSDAAINLAILRKAGTPIIEIGDDLERLSAELDQAGWIVDAILGTGASGQLSPRLVEVIDRMNRASVPIFAVDVPSGMDCDTGLPLGACVRAAHTATFVARKIGFDAPGAADRTGEVHVIDIGAPKKLLAELGERRR